MEKEYTISIGMKLFYGALAIGMFIFSMMLYDSYNPRRGAFILIIPTISLVGSALIFVNIIRRKLILYNDSLFYRSLFATKELNYQQIKGCRVGDKIIVIESESINYPKITISNYIDFTKSDELEEFFKERFEDLDALDLENQKSQLLQDSTLGYTEQDRNESLAKAKRYAITYNIAGVVVGLAGLFLESKITSILLIAYPLLGLLVIFFSKGLIKFLSNSKRSAYSFIAIGFIISTVIILAKTTNEFSVFQYDNVWVPCFAVGLTMWLILSIIGVNKSVELVKGQIVFMLIISLLYGFASIIEINCVFDDSKFKVYPAAVLDHRISRGKHDSYYLTLSNWGPRNDEKEVDVGKGLYQNTNIGDTVMVNYKNGLLNIPWFIVTK